MALRNAKIHFITTALYSQIINITITAITINVKSKRKKIYLAQVAENSRTKLKKPSDSENTITESILNNRFFEFRQQFFNSFQLHFCHFFTFWNEPIT